MNNYEEHEHDDYEEGDDPMQEIKQREIDELILADAFKNSYMILTKEISFDEMLDNKFNKNMSAVLAFDPEEGPLLYELENMIEFYIDSEEYERCSKIRDIMHEKFPNSILTE
jgi:hypothetical protein